MRGLSMNGFATFAASLCLISFAVGQEQSQKTPIKNPTLSRYIRCGALVQPESGKVQRNVLITIQGERIQQVQENAQAPADGQVIDLSDHTCLPGLIDTHTHTLLQGDITAADYDEQLLKQSTAYRAILGTRSVRRALDYGFTTIRDLETEGAGYADVDLKKAINNGIIPGPRMKVATRAMDVTGAYPLLGYSPEITVPHGVQVVDGPEDGRKAVREQISYGADWIKVYSDRSYFVRPDGVLDDIPTFTLDELRAIVDEAHRQHHKVASHAMALNGVHNSVEAGVDSIEHGNYIAEADIKTMAQKGIFYVPTIYVGEYVAQGRAAAGAKVWLEMLKIHEDTFRRALNAGVKIAFGTDVGGFDWGIDPAVEFPYMVKYGMTPIQAIRAATSSAAELLGMQNDVGSIAAGKYADLVAVKGDPVADIDILQKIDFVMKGGEVHKGTDFRSNVR
jgi:imidazolonepropionase-like amidohydrolase